MQTVKRAFVLLIFVAFSALGDERAEKRQLVSELLEVMDAKGLVQTSLENFMNTLSATMGESHYGFASDEFADEFADEYRAQYEAERKKEAERMRVFRERMYANIDYDRYFEETYVPMFEEQFTNDELRELTAFFRTRHGQKLSKIVPRLGVGAEIKAMKLIEEAANATQKELAKEDAAKRPWKATMSDMRTIATALEARATDVDGYPNVTFAMLEELLAPTYIQDVPKVDSWGTPFLYISDGVHYRFVSAGADRHFEWSSRQIDLTETEPASTTDLDADIVFQDGTFLMYPVEP